MRHSGNSPFAFGTEWEKVAIEMANDSLSVDNYYGIKDLTGNEILQTGTIHGELTRLVGQMLFCFYKVGPGGVSDPVPVNDKTVASVMDRISSIDITYEGVPRLITFDSGNHPGCLARFGNYVEPYHSFLPAPGRTKGSASPNKCSGRSGRLYSRWGYTKRYLPTAHPTRGSGINVFSLLRYHSDM